MANILADGVKNVPHIKAFNDLVEDCNANIDRTPLLIYLIDTTPADALPYLAEQFDVLGIKGMKYADTEAKQRALIKNAIALHRYKGTNWAIKEALKSIGVVQCTIIEGLAGGIQVLYDGTYDYDGSITYGFQSWAVFRVLIDIYSFPYATTAVLAEMRQLIEEYKPARSTLIDVSFGVNNTDTLTATEEFGLTIQIVGDQVGTAITYNGAATYNGVYHYSPVYDELVVNVIIVP